MNAKTNPIINSVPAAAFEAARNDMVAKQIRARGVRSPRVLDAMATVPRHEFVPPESAASAYSDEPLPIGGGQTISQPLMVAVMTDCLLLDGSERVLEIGGGSGYQAAVLSLLAREVVVVELQPELARACRERLARLGFSNVHVEEGDGSLGWPASAPYDAILVSAAAPAVPPPLVEQLAEGGRLVVPVGSAEQQDLMRIVKRDGWALQEKLSACRFVPLLGRHGWQMGPQETVQGTPTDGTSGHTSSPEISDHETSGLGNTRHGDSHSQHRTNHDGTARG
jgi:protein-L-isoaspartate(D-aspartate) O-methyltransferase